MRIISQNGTYNFPFEGIYLGLDANDMSKINAYSASNGVFLKTVAIYTNPNQARQILEELTENKTKIYQFPPDENLG